MTKRRITEVMTGFARYACAGWARLSFSTLIERPPVFYLSLEGGLDGLPLRVSNEGLLRPRVARA